MHQQLYLNYKVSWNPRPEWIPRLSHDKSRGCSWPRGERKQAVHNSLTIEHCSEISLKRKRKDSPDPASFISLGSDWCSSQPRHKFKFWSPWALKQSSAPTRVSPRGNKMNSVFTTNFKGDYFKQERKSMLRRGNWNQYTHGDGFNWNKKKVHWCISNKFPSL